MDIRFWLRRPKNGAAKPGTVYCSLSTGKVKATPFSTGIAAWPPVPVGCRPTPRSWQLEPVQRLYGDTPDVKADNDTLNALYHRLRAIKTELENKGLAHDARAVADALKHFGKPIPTLLEAADAFLEARAKLVRADDATDKTGFSANTIRKYRARLGLLTEYLKKQQHVHMPLSKFTAKHGDGVAEMVMTRVAKPGKHAGSSRGKCGPHYAGKVVGLIRQVLDYAINQEWLEVNPLAAWSPPRGFDKELVYLMPEQVTALESYPFATPYLQRVADSFLFCCWTGLAWADMDAFEPSQHVAAGWLAMQRAKTGSGFNLPLLPGALRLLEKYAHLEGGLPRYENSPMNRTLKEIGGILGWQQTVTTHAARRTFGMFLLNEDVPLATVSAVLGHKNQRTTERYYAKFIERRKIARDFDILAKRLGQRPD